MDYSDKNALFREIPITDIGGFRIGNVENYEAMTGMTVILFNGNNAGGICISGGGPASREAALLSPSVNYHPIHALVLSGGSAYGLDASGGVMKYLEEHHIGYQLGNAVIPLVCQSCIFDLPLGSPRLRPDAEMGYLACLDAEQNKTPKSGIYGAGTGATVGKIRGIWQGQKSGIGYFALQTGYLKIGAVAVVNAFGDIYDYHTGEKIAGTMNEERTAFLHTEEALVKRYVNLMPGSFPQNVPGSTASEAETGAHANTTLGAVFTNAAFHQADMNKIASMAENAYGRCIRPVGTMADGDTVYAFSVGNEKADINLVGSLAATVLSEAILKAVRSASMPDEEYLALLPKRN